METLINIQDTCLIVLLASFLLAQTGLIKSDKYKEIGGGIFVVAAVIAFVIALIRVWW